jgi:dCMP deaminase
MNRPNWNEYFMNIASVVSTRSEDPNTHVGCVIVDKKNRIVSTGYNNTPPGYPNDKMDWSKENKNKVVSHAEQSAIIFAQRDLSECSLYSTLQPCPECAKFICASGIKTVYYAQERYDKDSLELFKNCGVTLKKVSLTINFEIH